MSPQRTPCGMDPTREQLAHDDIYELPDFPPLRTPSNPIGGPLRPPMANPDRGTEETEIALLSRQIARLRSSAEELYQISRALEERLNLMRRKAS